MQRVLLDRYSLSGDQKVQDDRREQLVFPQCWAKVSSKGSNYWWKGFSTFIRHAWKSPTMKSVLEWIYQGLQFDLFSSKLNPWWPINYWTGLTLPSSACVPLPLTNSSQTTDQLKSFSGSETDQLIRETFKNPNHGFVPWWGYPPSPPPPITASGRPKS